MKLSKYNYIVKKSSYFLIYNTFTCACVILNQHEYNSFCNTSHATEKSEGFIKMGLWVNDECDETQKAIDKLKEDINNSKYQVFKIYTTMKCNAKCYYCFEQQSLERKYNINCIEDIVTFIKNHLIPNKKTVIEFFGGEPLINSNGIDDLCKKLNSNNIDFYSKMITNGYLFNQMTIANSLKNWRLKVVQITLDGMNYYYEKVKKFGDSNSFERVIENIDALTANKVIVNIRINYSKTNFDEVINLIHFLGEKYAKNEMVGVYTSPIFETESESNGLKIALFNEMLGVGLINNIYNTITTRAGRCIANLPNSYAIYTNGKIGKCSRAISDGEFIGNIYYTNREKEKKWINTEISVKCTKCKRFPLCNGGCIYKQSINEDFCEIDEDLLLHKLNLILDENISKKNKQ